MRMERVFLIIYIFTCCTVLIGEGMDLRKKEAVLDLQSKTENPTRHNVELNASSTLETLSSHKPEIKEEDHIGLQHEAFCSLCVCEHLFDKRCLTLCCNNSSSNKSPLGIVKSQETATSPDATATNEDHANQERQHNDSRSGSQAINRQEGDMNKVNQEYHYEPGRKIEKAENQADAESQQGSGRPKSEESTNLGSDAIGVSSPDPVSVSAVDSSSKLWNIVFVLSSAALTVIVLFISIKLWKRKELRECYFTMSSEFRPSSLSEALNDHSD